MTAARGRWVVDKNGELVEDRPAEPEPQPIETEEDRKKRERDERDAHPGNYL